MAYDASGTGHKVLDTPILLNIEVGDEGIPTDNDVEVSTDYSVSMMDRSKYSFETNYMPDHIQKMHDGNLYGNPWWIDTSIDEDSDDSPYVYVHFTSKTVINGIRITQNTTEKRIGQVFIYAVTDEGAFVHQGTYDASGSQKPRFLYIKFKKPIKASKLYLGYFRNTDNQYIDINEMQFF